MLPEAAVLSAPVMVAVWRREPEVSWVSARVFGADGPLVAAVSVTGPDGASRPGRRVTVPGCTPRRGGPDSVTQGLRVGLVCGQFDPVQDGVADYTRLLAGQLRAAGLETLICTGNAYAHTGDETAVGVTDRWTAGGVIRGAREIARLRLDLVHVQFAPSAFGFSRAVGLLPALLPRRTPVLATLHEYGVWATAGRTARLRSAAWSALERCGYADRETLLLSTRADRLLVTAPEHQLVLSARFPARDAAAYVPIGPNIQVADLDGEQPRAAVRRALGLPGGALLAVFFGFLHPEKGLEHLIEALAQVRSQHPRLRLVLAGGERSHSVNTAAAAALRRELDDLARRRGVQDAVIFTGYLPAREISRLLQAADAAVFAFNAGVTSKSGSLLAALAHGVPTIATSPLGEVTGASEIGGVLRVPPRDTAALAHALQLIVTDPHLAERLSRSGRAQAAARTWQVVVARHIEMYNDVLRRSGRR